MEKQKIPDHFTVREKYSRYWPSIVIGSALLTFTLWAGSHSTSNLLIEGYLRLGAFSFFALTLLGLFKLKEGRIRIDFTPVLDGLLQIDYLIRDKPVGRQSIELSSIESVEPVHMPDRTLYNNLVTTDRTLGYQPKKGDDWLYLTEFRERPVPLTRENAAQAAHFLNSLLDSNDPENRSGSKDTSLQDPSDKTG